MSDMTKFSTIKRFWLDGFELINFFSFEIFTMIHHNFNIIVAQINMKIFDRTQFLVLNIYLFARELYFSNMIEFEQEKY